MRVFLDLGGRSPLLVELTPAFFGAANAGLAAARHVEADAAADGEGEENGFDWF